MIEWFQNRDNITFVIAVAGFIMSLATWIFNLWNRRVHLEIIADENGLGFSISDVSFINKTLDGDTTGIALVLPCFYINRSSTAISITQILLIGSNGTEYRVALAPEFAFHRFRKMIDTDKVYERIYETTSFPLNLGPLQAEHSPFQVVLPNNVNIKGVKIITNRKTFKCDHLAVSIQRILDEKNQIGYDGKYS